MVWPRLSPRLRSRLRRLASPLAIFGWLPVIGELFRLAQGIDFIAKVGTVISPGLPGFIRDWGWALGILWLGGLVMFRRDDDEESAFLIEMERFQQAATDAARRYAAFNKKLRSSVSLHDWNTSLSQLQHTWETTLIEMFKQAIRTAPEGRRRAYELIVMRVQLNLFKDEHVETAHLFADEKDSPITRLRRALSDERTAHEKKQAGAPSGSTGDGADAPTRN